MTILDTVMGIGWLRWWRVALFTAIAVVGLVVAGSWIVLRVWGPAFTRERVEALLSEALDQPAHVGAVHLQPWRLRVSLVDLDVPAAATAPRGVRLRAPAIHVGIDVASVWRRQITLSALATDVDLEMTIPARETTTRNIFPLPEFLEIGPLQVGVGSVRVKNGRAVIRHSDPALTVEVSSADVTARPTGGDLEIAGRLDTVRVRAAGRHEQIDRVVLDGRLSADVVRIRRIAWQWQGESTELEGEVRHPWVDARELSVRAKGDVSLAAVARATGLDQRLDGKARITAEITGPLSAVQIAGRVRIAELGLPEAKITDVAVAGRWADRALRLDDIQARLGGGRIKGRLEVDKIARDGASVRLDVREVVLPGDLANLGPGTALAEGRVRDGGIDLLRGEANWRGLVVSLDGRIAAGPQLAARGRVSATLADVARAMRWEPMSGRATVSAELSGRGQARVLEGRTDVADLVAAGRAVEPVRASFRLTSPQGPNARWEGNVEVPRVAWSQAAVEHIAASLAVDAKHIEVIRARAQIAAIPVEATGQWAWAGAGRSRVALGPVSLGAIRGAPPALGVGGTGRATVDIAVERGVASTTALVELDQVNAAGVSLGAGRSEVRVRGRALEAELSFPSRRLRATAAGRLEAGGTLAGRLDVDDLSLQPLLRELDSAAANHVEGRVSARGEVSLPLDQPSSVRGVVRLRPEGLRLVGEPWTSQGPIVLRWDAPRLLVERFRLDGPSGSLSAQGALIGPDDRGLSIALDNARLPGALAELGRGTARVAMRLDGGNVELSRFDARWPTLTAVASGRARADGSIEFTGRVDGDVSALGSALGVPGARGRVVLTADARGRRDAIEAEGLVRASRIELRGATVSDVELPLRFSRSTLRVERARATLGTSRVSADASVTWPDTGLTSAGSSARDVHVKAEVRAPATRLEDLAPLLPSALDGRGELAVTARGAGTPRAWRGSGTLTAPLVELPAGPLRQLRAQFALDRTKLDVTDLRVDALGVPTRAKASWEWAGGGSAKATLGPASLAGLTMMPAGAGLEGTGQATIDVVLRSPADATGRVHATFEDAAVGGVRLGRGQIEASGKDGVYRAEIAFPEQRLQASGRARVEGGNMLSAEVALPAIDLGLLAKATAPTSIPVSGTLSARATGRVPLAEPRRGEGVLSIDPVRLVVGSETWETRTPISVRWAQGAVSLAPFRLASKEGQVSAEGALAVDGTLDARATAQLPLTALREGRPEIRDIGGVLDATLRASGRLTAPIFTGDGAIHRGNLLLRDRPETLRDVEARFTLSGQGIRLTEATAALSGGRVQARGDLALRGWEPGAYRVRLQAEHVALGQIDGFSSAWDADLELAGIAREAQLSGRARLVRGLYNRDLSILSLVTSPARAAAADTGLPVRLRVRVDLDDNLVVRTRAANLRAGGVLNAEGTTVRPIVFGSIESRDGRLLFRGRTWDVTSAAVRFADPRRLDPYLDVLATSRIAEYDVTMQISGPVSNVSVRFSSTPRLSQNDLLSLVAFGATGADIKESPGTILLGEAGKLLAQNVLGVDPAATGLRISAGSSAASGASDVHGFPGEDRSIASRTSPGARKDTVRVEYQLWAPLFLSGEYDRDGGYGTDVVLRFRFR